MATPKRTPPGTVKGKARVESGHSWNRRVLVVDDEPVLCALYERALRKHGYDVTSAHDGLAALALLRENHFDAIVSDISMPGMDGLHLLKRVREKDFDLPVILITGRPALETAVLAVEHGALLYLVKPVGGEVLRKAVDQATLLYRMARLKREALAQLGEGTIPLADRSGLEAAFNRAMKSLRMAYQPIVAWPQKKIHAYEALLRTNDPTLTNPGVFLSAAERLGRLDEVGRTVRARVSEALAENPLATFFVNLHTRDLMDDSLYHPKSPLSLHASRVVLEVTERTSLDSISDVRPRIASLRKLGFKIAIDDLGAGYAGLASFAALEPDVVKLDMSLVRNLDTVPTKYRLVRSMVSLCGEMGTPIVGEGVETVGERDALASIGCPLMQGFLFAWPSATLPEVSWHKTH